MEIGLDPRVWPGLLILVGLFLVARLMRSKIFSIILIGLLIFQVAFFRDIAPRNPPGGDNVLSPASGKVTLVDTVQEERFLKEEAWRIRIFLSLWSVHVTRSPIAGKVLYQQHVPGEHLNALREDSSKYNESNWIGIKGDEHQALVRQLAGAIARRIYSDVSIGEAVTRGGKLGVICYGSTVELYIPKKSFKPTIEVGQDVKTGETILGEWTTKAKQS